MTRSFLTLIRYLALALALLTSLPPANAAVAGSRGGMAAIANELVLRVDFQRISFHPVTVIENDGPESTLKYDGGPCGTEAQRILVGEHRASSIRFRGPPSDFAYDNGVGYDDRPWFLAPKSLGPASFGAHNGVGQIFSSKVTLSGKNIEFEGFAVGTQRGFFGSGPKGATELLTPMKKLIEYSRKNGAETITLTGKYVTEEGAKLGGGKVGEAFSHTFPATNEGFKAFLKGLR